MKNFDRQTEQYFQALNEQHKRWTGPGNLVPLSGPVGAGGGTNRREQAERARDLKQRQKWLVNFSAQVIIALL